MTDPQRRLQAVARFTGNTMFALAVIIFGLSLRNLANIGRYEGTDYTLMLVGTILQTIFIPTLVITLGLGLRRAAADAAKAQSDAAPRR